MTVPSFARWRPKRGGVIATRQPPSSIDHGASGLPAAAVAWSRLGRGSRARPANLLTMVTAIRPGGAAVVRRFFEAARRFPAMGSNALRDMGLIRAAYWTVLEELPDGNGEAEPLRPAYLLFESTYDVDLGEYIDVFARTQPWQMRAIWGTGVGYPGVLPPSAFNRWVEEHSHPMAHEWRAYPEATTRMVASGLRVAERLRTFEAAVARGSDEDFAFEFRRLLVELQEDLS